MAALWQRVRPRKETASFWVVGALGLAAWLLFVHPDVIETSNHAYVLLESIAKGRFLEFYNDVMLHDNTLYYINFAHYNIVMYLLFAVVQLPVFLVCRIGGLAVSEPLLYFLGKLVSAGFFVGCAVVVWAIARQLKLTAADARLAALCFLLWPAAFFSALVMGQYDTVCLFFMLLAVLRWLQGRTGAFAFWMGLAAVFKFFALLVFVPLLLLCEKEIFTLLRRGLTALWLLVPTGLLFHGRTGDMGLFNSQMMVRLFAAELPGGSRAALFPLAFLLLCFFAYLYRCAKADLPRTGLWLALAAFCCLFLLVDWHPQWLVLLAPFVVLTTLLEKNRLPWLWLDVLLAFGFFVLCFMRYGSQLESNLLDFGLVGILSGLRTTGVPGGYNPVAFYLRLVPVLPMAAGTLFGTAVGAQAVFKAPCAGGSWASRLSGTGATPAPKATLPWVWACFSASMAFWFVPTLFTWLKCFGFL